MQPPQSNSRNLMLSHTRAPRAPHNSLSRTRAPRAPHNYLSRTRAHRAPHIINYLSRTRASSSPTISFPHPISHNSYSSTENRCSNQLLQHREPLKHTVQINRLLQHREPLKHAVQINLTDVEIDALAETESSQSADLALHFVLASFPHHCQYTLQLTMFQYFVQTIPTNTSQTAIDTLLISTFQYFL
jgi:hypothetical protein